MFIIRDNIIVEPETLTEILWIHDRQGYHELEVRSLAAPNATSITFTAPSWYFNPSTLRNRTSSSSNTLTSVGEAEMGFGPRRSHHNKNLT